MGSLIIQLIFNFPVPEWLTLVPGGFSQPIGAISGFRTGPGAFQFRSYIVSRLHQDRKPGEENGYKSRSIIPE